MENQERIVLVDMERRLLDDKTGEYRSSILEKLEYYLSDIKNKLSCGLKPDEFAVFSKLKDSIEAAKKILRNFK